MKPPSSAGILPALALSWVAVLAHQAHAHALLIASEPEAGAVVELAPPKRVVARYSQELESGSSSIRVFDGAGRQVDGGDGRVDLDDPDHANLTATLPGGLAAGSYTVRWEVVSAEDGDTTEGEFRFSVAGAAARASGVAPGEARRPAGWAATATVAAAAATSAVALGAWARRRARGGGRRFGSETVGSETPGSEALGSETGGEEDTKPPREVTSSCC